MFYRSPFFFVPLLLYLLLQFFTLFSSHLFVVNREDLNAKIEDLTNTIATLTDAIDTLKSELEELKLNLQRAGEDRALQNKEFQAIISDQRATQALLAKTLSVLEGFYKKAAFEQQPAGFKEYKKDSGNGGVMGMIQEIIDDAKTAEADAIHDEENAQKAYEDFVKESNASIEAKTKDSMNKTELKAKAEAEKVEAEKELENTMLELEQLANYKGQLHSSCDFVMKNFEIRQTARDEEVEALKQAKAILSGAKFEAFLQQAPA